MAEYTLYIDESETFNSSGKKYFVMSGVIIRETNYPAIQSEMEALKRKVWNNAAGCENYILHEKDVSFANFPLNSSKLSAVASCYHIFTDTKKVQLLYNELSKLFKKSDLYTIGVCLDKSVLFELGRYVAGMKPKNKNFAKIVRKKLYDGCQDKTYRFGFKVLS